MFRNDLVGKRFGHLEVLNYVGNDKSRHSTWLCRCDCGNEKVISSGNLISGNSTTCGCDKNSNRTYWKTHGMTNTRLYSIWRCMKTRTTYKSNGVSECYRSRDIKTCEEWKNSFQKFYEWSIANGYADNLTIDRIDNSKGYSPENCRWITNKEQQNNRRNNVRITYNGETKTLVEWSELYGISYNCLRGRIVRGWDIEKALTTK